MQKVKRVPLKRQKELKFTYLEKNTFEVNLNPLTIEKSLLCFPKSSLGRLKKRRSCAGDWCLRS